MKGELENEKKHVEIGNCVISLLKIEGKKKKRTFILEWMSWREERKLLQLRDIIVKNNCTHDLAISWLVTLHSWIELKLHALQTHGSS